MFSTLPSIVLQNSFWIAEDKFSGLWARRSNDHVGEPEQLAINSPATSVARLRTHRSAIVAWLLFSRKNRCSHFWSFATQSLNNGHQYDSLVPIGRLRPLKWVFCFQKNGNFEYELGPPVRRRSHLEIDHPRCLEALSRLRARSRCPCS
jgi:hypothetical protein